jgi:acyl-homoserine lactone synthase
MLFALTTQELMERPDLWEASHRLRYRIFVEETGRADPTCSNGRQVDEFDHDEAIHQIVIRGGELAGYQRMLPTTRAHPLADLYVGEPPCGPNIYKLTRYAIAPGFRDGRRGTSAVGIELIAGFVEWGLRRDVNRVIIELEPMWVLHALQLHFLATPLGYPRRCGSRQVVATLLTFDEHTLQTIRARRNHFAPVLAEGYPERLGRRWAS